MSNSAAVWSEVVSFEAFESKPEHHKISSFAESEPACMQELKSKELKTLLREQIERGVERPINSPINPWELSYYGINTIVSLKDKCLRPKEMDTLYNARYNSTGLWA